MCRQPANGIKPGGCDRWKAERKQASKANAGSIQPALSTSSVSRVVGMERRLRGAAGKQSGMDANQERLSHASTALSRPVVALRARPPSSTCMGKGAGKAKKAWVSHPRPRGDHASTMKDRRLVDLRGFEPLTSRMRTARSPAELQARVRAPPTALRHALIRHLAAPAYSPARPRAQDRPSTIASPRAPGQLVVSAFILSVLAPPR